MGQPYNNSLLRQYLTREASITRSPSTAAGAATSTNSPMRSPSSTAQNPALSNQLDRRRLPRRLLRLESSLTVPPFTLIQGFTAPGTRSIQPQGRPMIQITGTAGAGVTLAAGSSVADVGFSFTGAPTVGTRASSADRPLRQQLTHSHHHFGECFRSQRQHRNPFHHGRFTHRWRTSRSSGAEPA